MTVPPSAAEEVIALRARARSHLRHELPETGVPAALGVLHELARSPATAAQALSLLHEMQVQQVEVDLQTEELRRVRTELELLLARQVQRYDAAPMAYVTLEPDTTLREANLTCERLLGVPRERLLGRRLESFLTAETRVPFRKLLAKVAPSTGQAMQCELQVSRGPSQVIAVRATASRDPAGNAFLVALIEAPPPVGA